MDFTSSRSVPQPERSDRASADRRGEAAATRRPGATRGRLLALLANLGPSSATRLGEVLGVSDMAARQHLHGLAAEGLTSFDLARGGVGRPTKLWSLTPRAEELAAGDAADGHAQLAAELLASLEAALGTEGAADVLTLRDKRLAKLYARTIDRKAPLRTRLEALARRRTAEGYQASLEVSPDGWYLLVEAHCPIRAAASACSALCDGETRLFKKALGKDVTVERREHRLSGDRRCSFAVRRT
ncbi:helix-turn-helix transcriptional regulator [Algihabitans albus]|uniref:helix-turn-helix transcriptional regulator n=1 Tax=Algihabitans albus TaxID=2164067 RepID=UPI000E5D1AEF|nr:transcriptional regulator [Algihabitans albus]